MKKKLLLVSLLLSSCSIDVSSKEIQLTQKMIDNLGNNLYLIGGGHFDYIEEGKDENYTSEMYVSFNDDSFVSYEKTSRNVIYSSRIVKRDGNPYTYFVNEKNEITYLRAETSSKVLTWNSFKNPFSTLSIDNFAKTSKLNEYMLKSSALVNEYSRVITGYSNPFQSFKVLLSEKGIQKIEIVGIGQDNYFVDIKETFNFDVRDTSTINPKPEVYSRSELHDYLDSAIDETLKSTFVIEHTDYHNQYGDTKYCYYFTSNAIYCDREEIGDTYPFGYVVQDDGVYKFTNSKAEGLVREYKVLGTLKEYYPNFKGFNSTIIKPISQEEFVSYDSDNASIIGKFIAENSEEKIYSRAANDLKITLKNKKLDKIEYFYSLVGGFTQGYVTMKFINYDNEDIPLDFSKMKDRSEIKE